MGKKLDALLGRSFKFVKLKPLLNITVSRIAVLKNQKKTRGSLARSDVTELLKQGHEERALLRVEHVIKEQNMLDVFVMMEGYCYLLIERGVLLENQRSCPEELKEAISSLVFAASRCGELPELQELRSVFTTRFGKEFTAAAAELRNSCGVNIKMIQKMSTRQPSLEIRMKVLREIATENGITINLEEVSSEKDELNQNQNQSKPNEAANVGGNKENSAKTGTADYSDDSVELDGEKTFSGRLNAKEKFTDVETAARVAFESAAYAAEAARAAVELSRSESQDKGSDDQSSPSPRRRRTKFDRNRGRGEGSSRSRFHGTPATATQESGEFVNESGFEKVHPIQNPSSESENELVKNGEKDGQFERSVSRSNSGEIEPNELDWIKSKALEKAMHFDESDDETNKGSGLDFDENHSATKTDKLSEISSEASNHRGRTSFGLEKGREFESVSDVELSRKDEDLKLHYTDQKQTPIRSPIYESHEDVDEVVDSPGKFHWQDSKIRNTQGSSDLPKKLPQKGANFVSVRTRRGF